MRIQALKPWKPDLSQLEEILLLFYSGILDRIALLFTFSFFLVIL